MLMKIRIEIFVNWIEEIALELLLTVYLKIFINNFITIVLCVPSSKMNIIQTEEEK